MNVASKELCEELYAVSGYEWSDTKFGWTWTDNPNYPKNNHELYDREFQSPAGSKDCPAYDLGYLLRRLIASDDSKYLGVSVRFVNQRLGVDLERWVGKWIAYHPWMRQDEYPVADTPEDAAAKLCIELIRQNIITPNQRERE